MIDIVGPARLETSMSIRHCLFCAGPIAKYNINGKLIGREDYSKRKWCCVACYRQGRHGLDYNMDPEARLRQLAPAKNIDECWPIDESHQEPPMCYGRFKFKGRHYRAHRLAYELEHGAIPRNCEVRHLCDYAPCTNPSHLAVGSRLDNMRDRKENGRSGNPRGVDSAIAALTKDQVLEIRRRKAENNLSVRQLAKMYAISITTAGRAAGGYGAYKNV